MTDAERFEFDLRGYIIYRNVLPLGVVRRAVAALQGIAGADRNGKFSFLGRDPLFLEIMAHPGTITVLKTLLGEWLRFDHGFGIQMTKESNIRENLHAGPMQNQRAFFYQWGPRELMHNGLIKVIYALNDVNEGDGGFICVPGSHKTNMSYKPPHDSHLVVNPTLRAGDMLIFTEALVHGSRQWVADSTRRVLIYSYAPGFLAWKDYRTMEPYLKFATTALQRDLLRPPFVGNYEEPVGETPERWPEDRRTPVPSPSLVLRNPVHPGVY